VCPKRLVPCAALGSRDGRLCKGRSEQFGCGNPCCDPAAFRDSSAQELYTLGAAIGAREKVREPGQDRKVATVPHASVMLPGRRVFHPLFYAVGCAEQSVGKAFGATLRRAA